MSQLQLEAAICRRLKDDVTTALKTALKRRKVSQSELARRMRTSRAVVHRMLKPSDVSITLTTLSRAFAALEVHPRLKLAR